MHIPPEVQVHATLQTGSVYYFAEDSPKFTSTEPHYFVVVNQDPRTEEFLILVCASSQVTKTQDRIQNLGYPEETLVLLTPDDYELFTKDTVINCNTVFQKSIQEIIEKGNQGNLRVCRALMPPAIVAQLQQGIQASPRIERKIKKMLPAAPAPES